MIGGGGSVVVPAAIVAHKLSLSSIVPECRLPFLFSFTDINECLCARLPLAIFESQRPLLACKVCVRASVHTRT